MNDSFGMLCHACISRVEEGEEEEEGIGIGGITILDMRIRAAAILGLDVITATVAKLHHHPDTCGLGIFLTVYRRMNSLIISCTLETSKTSHFSLVVAMLSLTSAAKMMQLPP